MAVNLSYDPAASKAGASKASGNFSIQDRTAEVGFGPKFGQLEAVKGMVIHHTGGSGGVNGVISTFKQRGYPAQFVIDRDGQVYQTLPDGARGQHIRNGSGKGEGLSNANTEGVEIIAKNDADVLPAQKAAAMALVQKRAEKWGYDPKTSVWGHGEVNPGHKESDEGMTVVSAIRGGAAPTIAAASDPFGNDKARASRLEASQEQPDQPYKVASVAGQPKAQADDPPAQAFVEPNPQPPAAVPNFGPPLGAPQMPQQQPQMTGESPVLSPWLMAALGPTQSAGFAPPDAQLGQMAQLDPQEPRKSIFDPPDSYPGAPPLDRSGQAPQMPAYAWTPGSNNPQPAPEQQASAAPTGSFMSQAQAPSLSFEQIGRMLGLEDPPPLQFAQQQPRSLRPLSGPSLFRRT